ncbi:MAG: hypothetical protein II968_07110 [Selenomonadaceae bacterium]|nr:hypothetical protein [Selenomonadaceae bacterium]MBQ6758427.1 hypothetical protein [Selenomonadaceae bacterium]
MLKQKQGRHDTKSNRASYAEQGAMEPENLIVGLKRKLEQREIFPKTTLRALWSRCRLSSRKVSGR